MNIAAQQIDIPLDDMQTQAGTFYVECIAAAEKAREEVLLILARDADALVFYGERKAPIGSRRDPQPDSRALRREFDGIAQEVDQDIL